MVVAFGQAGLDWEGGSDAEATLLALRATYEPLLDGLARHLLLALPGWVPNADAVDHWEHGHRGLLARRLVDQLADRAPAIAAPGGEANIWRTLRRRLRAGSTPE
jgi:hypothetical protein